jgi:hypothetical protein
MRQYGASRLRKSYKPKTLIVLSCRMKNAALDQQPKPKVRFERSYKNQVKRASWTRFPWNKQKNVLH